MGHKQDKATFDLRRGAHAVGAGTAAAGIIDRALPTLAKGAGMAAKVARGGTVVGVGLTAGYGAYQGAGEDNNTLRGAARGSVRALDPSTAVRSPGYAEEAFNAKFGPPDPVQFRRSWGEAVQDAYGSAKGAVSRAFDRANQHFHDLHLSGPKAEQSDGDTFERTRHDARSGKEITETVRKRGKAP